MAAALFLVLVLALRALPMPARAQTDTCDDDPRLFLPNAYNATEFHCTPVWNTFILRYSQSQDNVLSVVLSAVYTVGWVGMGFSKDGMMVGSSAMVGWIGKTGRAHIRRYYLRGQSSSQVIVNEGQLQTTDVSPMVILYGANIYLAFQLKFSAPLSQQELLFAVGSRIPVNYRLTEHDDKTSVSFDFAAGSSSPSSSYPYQLKRNHGALNIFGWGVLLPIGAIIARYCKQWDPLWFYLHVGIQFFGFIIGLSGIVCGVALYNKLHSSVSAHRGLGIFIFVLGILQIIAFFLRPDKDSKIRKYWNWYHHWSGRLALFLASVNIVYGIQVAHAGSSWKVGYGINLAFLLIAVIVLEILSWTRWSQKTVTPPAF
ncbi:cytochrome b561 and DOMON domain-containing protein At3g61750 [Dioscorea cayenensis subsp. rotundata]|uniref:Cytochrome b561 and DOMON domain-containing protein At3g61750 n=1 Tax=Dioscorea cayennensis subsp. rotundata TaxID=55577 RepID=A0AB40AR86_DIOCR|nr:cytochrome b561 and DOMON domain-containing protein At3g61750 [Dioscorea cayenensis subsp. rotundata]